MPVDNGEYVEPEGGIKGALTRPLGPLPVWGWAAVLIGGYFLFRILRGGGSSSGGGTVVGGSGSSGGNGADGTNGIDGSLFDPSALLDSISGLQDQLANQSGQIGNLNEQLNLDTGLIGQLTNLSGLQAKLNEYLTDKTSLAYTRSQYWQQMNTARDKLRLCTTTACKTQYNTLINELTTKLTTNATQIATVNSQIAALEKQIQDSQPSSTTLISSPTTTPIAPEGIKTNG